MKNARLITLAGVGVALALACGEPTKDDDTGTPDSTPPDDTNPTDDTGPDTDDTGPDTNVTGVIALSHAGAVIASGGDYNVPDDNDPASSNMPLFSEQKDLMTITNVSDAAVTINSITLTEGGGVYDEEWTLRDADSLTDEVLELADLSLAAGETVDFYLACQPVFSDERAATLTIQYTDGGGAHDYVVDVTGSGHPGDDAHPFSGGTVALHKLLGSLDTDEQATAMVADSSGNTYFSLQTKEVPGYDGYYYDTVVGKVSSDGDLEWAKIYSRSPAWEYSPDPGQNDETGGSPNALALDGYGGLYLAGCMSQSTSNNNNAVHVMKVDTNDGDLSWDVIWRPEWTTGSYLDRMAAFGYALDVAGGRVFVTGSTGDGAAHGTLGSSSSVLLLGLSASDGSLAFQTAVDVESGYNDRGHAVKANADGSSVFVGGLENGAGLLMRFDDTDGASPSLGWVERLDMGTGSNVYGLDYDDGDLYLALDRRGASTAFSFARVAGADGSVTWAKTYEGNFGDNDNCNVVSVFDDYVYAGGRLGVSVMDSQMGDGQIVRVAKEDGAFDWAGTYYTGKSPDEIEEHRVKGIAVVGGDLYLAGQVYTGNTGSEYYRYDGYWYDDMGSLADYALTPAAITDADQYTPSNGEVRDVDVEDGTAVWDDLPADVEWVDAAEKALGTGGTVDEEFFWMKLEL
ncbi:MAG: hypothetical protein ABIO70_17585 [Pseudomonadota bacterium]